MTVVVLVTIPIKDAKELTNALLRERACACINIIKGVESHFWWKGKIDSSQEALLLIKTRESLFGKLKQLIENNHPYDTCEVIAFKVDYINKKYLDWLNGEVDASTSN